MDLINRARRYLAKMDRAIQGNRGSDRTFAAACALVHGFALDSDSALNLLREWNSSHCEPPWMQWELEKKIRDAIASAPEKPIGYLSCRNAAGPVATTKPKVGSPPRWPSMDPARVIDLLENRFISLAELESYSPVLPSAATDPLAIIDTLFLSRSPIGHDPWLCIAPDVRLPITKRRSELTELIPKARFVVPNPMKGPDGVTMDGRQSVRSISNTGPRQFLVVECDFTRENSARLFDWLESHRAAVADLCATVLFHLAEIAPMVMAVHSGGKSLHGWFATLDQPESTLRHFMRHACLYGADKATWTKCQFVRLPGATRENGNPQKVHYFNNSPELLGATPTSE